MTVTIFHMICEDFHSYVSSSHKIDNKREQNRVVVLIMTNDDNMTDYCRCEADRCNIIVSYTNKYYYEGFSSMEI